jgi:glycosyltransferase involved in cell wall biosynthesis
MKLCQIVPSLEERYGGPSKSVYELSSALAQAGNDIELLATDPGVFETRSEGRLKIEIFHRGWPDRLCVSAGLRSAVRVSSAEIIHHHSLWLRTLHYAHGAAKRRRVPLVVSPRGMMSAWAWEHHRFRKAVAQRFLHPGALAAVSGWHATSLAEEAEIRDHGYSQPICVAPNGVAAPPPEEGLAAVAAWREKCPAITDKPTALFFSRFHRKKRVIELIDLWMDRGPEDWVLLLVGIPEDYSPETLTDYILRAGGAGRAYAFSGAGMPPPYAVASLFMLPSHSENFGLVIAEALASGVPALVTDSTPWSGLNENGGGWCVPWADFPAALAAAVAEGPSRLADRGNLARAWVLREYSWSRPASKLMEFYGQLSPSRPS